MAVHPSHEEEQARVREFFGGDNSGYFVEVGANHPTHGSQTWHLEQAGWTGVLVEPQPDLAAFLVTSRKARVFATACSSPDNAGQSLQVGKHTSFGLGAYEVWNTNPTVEMSEART